MSYIPEWVLGFLVALVVLPFASPFAMVASVIVLLVALALLLALAGAIAAAPYLLIRSARSRLVQHVADRRNGEPLGRGLEPVPSKEM